MSFAFIEDRLFEHIREFMRSEHEVDEREENERAQKDKEYDGELRKKWSKEFEQAAKEEDDYREVEGHTLAEIRLGLRKKYEEAAIKQALQENEEELAHKPHPDGTRYALRKHLTSNHYAMDWKRV